jgi:hypothetical protein
LNGVETKTTSALSLVVAKNTASKSFDIPVPAELFSGSRGPNTLFPLIAYGINKRSAPWTGKIDGIGVDNQSRRGEPGTNGAFSDAWIMAPYVEEPNLILMGTGADAANGDSITQTPDEVGLVAPPMLNYYYKYAWWYGTEENSEEGGLKLTLQDQTNPPLVAPIKIKNMEQTNILVNVVPIVSVVPENVAYGVSASTTPPLIPTEEALQEYLDLVFLDQINLKCHVSFEDEREVVWDTTDHRNNPNDYLAPFPVDFPNNPTWGDRLFDREKYFDDTSPEQTAIHGELKDLPDAPRKITVYVIGGATEMRYIGYVPDPFTAVVKGTGGIAQAKIDKRICYVASNHDKFTGPPLAEGLENICHTIAHEIGHIVVGGGHPDNPNVTDGGPASFDSPTHQDHYSRLMLSGDGIGDRRPIKLVKAEWDAAEVNLPSIIFNP